MSDERVVEADAVRLFVREEGIVIDFGRNVTPPGSTEDLIETVSKMLVPATTFRRLGMALQEAIRHLPPEPTAAQPSPAATGTGASGAPTPAAAQSPRISFIGADTAPVPAEAKPPLEALLEPTRDMPSSRAETPAANEHATRLYALVTGLRGPYVYERSFRMRPGELLTNRFLLSVGRPDDGSASDAALTAVFRELGLPESFVEATQEDLPRARCVHFGFEGDGDSPLLKVYLEIGGEKAAKQAAAEAEREAADDAGEATEIGSRVLEHVAYKWDPLDTDRRAVGRYWWYPHLSAAEISARVEGVYQGAAAESQEIAHSVIALAAERMPERDIHYLEIEEEGNARRSYSINFYDADLLLRDLYPMLSRMRRQYDVPPGRFQVLYDQIKTRRFGHLAGGVHRNGKDFFNVYYGPQFFDQGSDGPWRGALMRSESGRGAEVVMMRAPERGAAWRS